MKEKIQRRLSRTRMREMIRPVSGLDVIADRNEALIQVRRLSEQPRCCMDLVAGVCIVLVEGEVVGKNFVLGVVLLTVANMEVGVVFGVVAALMVSVTIEAMVAGVSVLVEMGLVLVLISMAEARRSIGE
jgi:hypothetical protein